MPRDRTWFTPKAGATWTLAVTVMTVGGLIGALFLGAGLCEDVGSPGSEPYCNHGGMEASIFTLLAISASTLVVPAIAVALGRRGLFWLGVCVPPALAVLEFVLATNLGQR
jgi:hypothetical protein